MANEVATLGIKIDSRDVLKADKGLDALTKTSKKTEKATDALTTSYGKNSSLAKKSETATGKLSDATERQRRAANDATNATNRQKTATKSLTTSMKAAGSAAIAYIAAVGAGKLKDAADEYTGMQNKLKQVTENTVELNTVTNALFATAEKTRSSIKSTTTLYSRLALASSELGLSQADLVGLTSTINKSFALSGATAEEAAAAITQLSQGLASGALRGDEFNSVAEQAPGIMRAIAKETNKSIGELREFASTGGITADIVVSALQGASDKIDQDFSKSVSTFAQSMENVENGFIRWAGESDNLSAAMSGAGQVVEVLASATMFLLDGLLMVGRGIFELDKLMISAVNSSGMLTDAFNFIGEISTDISNNWQQGIIAGLGLLTNGFLHAGEAIAGPFVLAFSVVDTVILDAVDSILQAATVLGEFGIISQETVATLELMQANTGSVKDKMDAFHESFAATRAEVDNFVGSAKEHLDWTIKQKKATDALTVSTEKGVKAKKKDQKATKSAIKEIKKALKETRALNNEFKTFSGDDVFADLANGLQSFASKEQQFHDQRIANEAAIAEAKKQGLEIEQDLILENAKLNATQAQSRLGQVSQIAESIAGGFEEGSEAGKVFTQVAKAAGIAQAAVAVASAASATPPVGLAAAAATLSLMSSIGLGLGGGGGSSPSVSDQAQASQGTGSVFGSSTSKAGALGTAFERLEDINLEQHNELRGIFGEMVRLNSNISGLTGVLVRSFGDFTDSELTSGIDFSSSGAGDSIRDASGEINAFINIATKLGTVFSGISTPILGLVDTLTGGLVGDFIADTLGSLGDALFGSTKKTIVNSGIIIAEQTFGALQDGIDAVSFATIKKKKKSIFGSKTSYRDVTGELDDTATRQLQLVFENMGGTIEQAIGILGIETENSLADFAVTIDKISLRGLDGEEIQKELEAVFSNQANLMAEFMVPELMNFTEAGEETFDTLVRLATEVSRFNSFTEKLNLTFSATGLEAVELIDNLTLMAGGTEKLNDSLSSYYENFFTASERQEDLTNALTGAMDELGFALPATREGFRTIVEGLDLATESGQEAFVVLTQFSESANSVFEAFEKGAEFVAGLQRELDVFSLSGSALDLFELDEWRDEQFAIANETGRGLAEIELLYGLQRQRILEQQTDLLIEQNDTRVAEMLAAMVSATDDAMSALSAAVEAERAVIDSAFDDSISAREDALATELDQIKASATAQTDAIKASETASTAAIKATEKARTDASKIALTAAKDGLKAISSELSGIVSALDKLRATTTPQKVLRAEALGVLQGALASGNLGGTGEAAGIAANINAAEFATASEFAREIGITSGVLSGLESSGLKQESAAQQAVSRLDATIAQIKASSAADQEQNKSIAAANIAASKFSTDLRIAAAQTVAEADIALLTEQHNDDTERFDSILSTAQEQLDTLRGIDNSVLSVADALNALSISMTNEDIAGPFDNDRRAPLQHGDSRVAARSSGQGFAGPTNQLSSNEQNSMLSRQELVAEMKALRAEVHELKNINASTAKSTFKSAKQTARWDVDGMPPVRT